jgi:NSS family neurotransmitter:Na+ symporter
MNLDPVEGESYALPRRSDKLSVASSVGDGVEEEEREKWGSNTAFLFAAIGSAIGLGNVVRFPYLAYRYGGVAFLIPYILANILVGLPILGLELMLGQRMQRGAIESMGQVHPRFWGVGVVALCGCSLLLLYYQVIMAWSWIYLFYSFYPTLPWGDSTVDSARFYAETIQGQPASWSDPSNECYVGNPSDEFAPPGSPLSCFGNVHWPLALGLALQYTLCWACNCQGVELIGKVVMVVMPLPFVMITVILVFGATRSGAKEGVEEYIAKADWYHLSNGDVWVDAISQIFFGLGE